MRRLLAVCSFSLLATVSLSGCTSLLHFSGVQNTPVDPQATAQGDAGQPQPTVQVVLKAEGGKTKKSVLPLTEDMSVQTVLEKTGAIRKFTDMEIKVYRVTPYSKGAVVPLQAEYDPSKNRVPILNDMALHAGDMVLVEENDVSQFQLMLKKLTGNAAQRRGLE